jgi:CO/xanthine dehydrogenase Mo-binding subunit
LHEEVTIGANGRVCQNSFETCRLPAALDVVPVETSLYEGAPSMGPIGTKGAGEVPIVDAQTQPGLPGPSRSIDTRSEDR